MPAQRSELGSCWCAIPQGFTRVTSLRVDRASGHDERAVSRVILQRGVPELTVRLPPIGHVRLTSMTLPLSGATAPGEPGSPSTASRCQLEGGRKRFATAGGAACRKQPVSWSIQVSDPEGRTGDDRAGGLDHTLNDLFLMAFADGKVGSLER